MTFQRFTLFNKNLLTAILFLFFALFANAQTSTTIDWRKMADNKSATFYQVQQDFTNYVNSLPVSAQPTQATLNEPFEDEEEAEEGSGTSRFKRWESYMAPRVYPSGNMALPSTNYSNFISWQNANNSQSQSKSPGSSPSAANWTEIGPIGSPSGPLPPYNDPYTRTGAGRVNFIRFDPTNSNTMYVGAPDGGLWKSTNGGNTWTTNTDFLAVIGCSDLAINPANTNTMYLATGDLEGNKNSIGILKSLDGGATWNTTGLVWTAMDDWKISKLIMDPTDPLKMIASTNGGVFITTDGWATYTTGNFGGPSLPDLKDMELKPGTPTTVYASGTAFWKSTDFGSTWTQITSGLPSSGITRIALGVTSGNAAYVYALIANNPGSNFKGLYRSTDNGSSFSLRSSTPNLLGYETNGSDNGGQGFYDLSIAVSSNNAEIVTTGGVNHWQSTDGGSTWTNLSVWDSGEVHADIHEISYLPGSSTTMFSCNDGGIFKSTDNGNNFVDISHNLAIAQCIGIGLSANIATTMVNGTQDNGSNFKSTSTWVNINGGDGGECFIDYTDNNIIYNQYVNGAFSRSDDGGVSNNAITTGLPSGFDFYSTWVMDPVNPSRLYVGGIPTLYTSADKGDNWTALGTPTGSGSIKGIAVAPSNTTIIYTIKNDAISKSTNSGTSFTNITGTLPVSNASLSNVTVSNTDPHKVWVTFSGYSAGEKVFKSVNGGTTWTNVSAGLPNLPVNEVIFTNGSAVDAIYIGADIGVYYLDNTLPSFAPFMTALPNVAVKDLEIFYPTGKLRAGTFGRGVWESDLYSITALGVSVNLKLFIEGYYTGAGTMVPTLKNQGVGTSTIITDSITVELRNSTSPYALVASTKTILHTDGSVAATFPGVGAGTYYIAINHRNGIQTWSANAIAIAPVAVTYDFSTAANKAYGSNMSQVATGVWALYAGELNNDENIDLLDLSILESDITNFLFGYYTTDLTGDGNVDLLDAQILEGNVNNFIYSNHP